MFSGALKVIRKCIALGIPGYLENPRSSRLWKTPQIRKLLDRGLVKYVEADFCQYGVPWKKATRIMIWSLSPPSQLKLCQAINGCCSRTHKPHLRLSGAVGAKWRTQNAEAYPVEFAKALANLLLPPPPQHTEHMCQVGFGECIAIRALAPLLHLHRRRSLLSLSLFAR